MGASIVHAGGNGSGQVVKLCNNLSLAIQMIGMSESMNLGMKVFLLLILLLFIVIIIIILIYLLLFITLFLGGNGSGQVVKIVS